MQARSPGHSDTSIPAANPASAAPDPPLRRRSRFRILLLGVALGGALLATGVIHSYRQSESAAAQRLQLTVVGGIVQEVSAAASEAMEELTLDRDLTQNIRALGNDLVRVTDEIPGDGESVELLRLRIADYWGALEDQTNLIEQGRLDAAREVDETRVDPLVPIIRAEILSATAAARSAYLQSARRVQLGLLGCVLFMLVITSLVVWRLGPTGQTTAVVQRSEARFRSLVKNSSDAITVVDDHGVIRDEGPSVVNVLGYGPGALTGRSVREVVHPADVQALTDFIGAAHDRDADSRVEGRWLTADGRWLLCETIVTNLMSDPHVRGWVLTTRDISDRKALESELTRRATHDSLTGLANRARFASRIDEALRRTIAPGSLAVLYIDVDDFKQVNDAEGHSTGDALLVELARRLRLCVRDGDEVARLGGDEFGILLERVTREEEAVAVAARILEALAQPLESNARRLLVSASVGVVIGASPGEGSADLVRKADQAMYVAKQRGKSGYEVYRPEIHATLCERVTVLADLRGAIAREEVVAYFQPIVEVATGRVARVEALARWLHPRRGVLAPAEFIALAEETGLIVDIGRQILRQACHQVAGYRAEIPGRSELGLNVNVAPRQLEDPNFAGDVQAALDDSGLPAAALTLELTESTLLRDPERVIPVLDALRAIGVGLAIDDFGTGFSSLSYLERLPVSHLKIDRSFAKGLSAPGNGGSPLLGAIVGLANAVGLQVTAEGIELAEQLERLQTLDCEFMQGYFISRPLPDVECANFLSDWSPERVLPETTALTAVGAA